MTQQELAQKLSKLPHKLQVRFALACARDIQHLVRTEDKEAIAKCLNTVELWLIDKASKQDVLNASSSASIASAYSSAYSSASASSSAASYVSYAAASSYATASASAAHATASSAYYAAAASSTAASSANASNKDLDYYHRILVDMINNFTEIERIMYGIE